MKTVSITDIYVKVWTKNIQLPQGKYLYSLMQTEITRQILFELTDIDYD